MKKIIAVKSSEINVGMENLDEKECLIDLQIILRIERLLGSKLPGSQFEAAELDCGFSERRKIRRKAKKTNTWVRFIKMDEKKYLLLTPSVKIVNKDTENLTLPELLAGLAESEIAAEKRDHSFREKFKKEFSHLKSRIKKKLHEWWERRKIRKNERG